MFRRRRVAILVLLIVGVAVSSSSSQATTSSAPRRNTVPAVGALPWPAPTKPMSRTLAAGLIPQDQESLIHHVHAHLDVFLDGVRQRVPAGLGINTKDPAVHSFPNTAGATAYGGIRVPCKKPCISPLHTHDATGVVHTESPVDLDNTLGELFVEWDVALNRKCVGGYCTPEWKIAIYENGTKFAGDPTTIPLTDRKEIAIVIGKAPPKIASSADFSAA